MPRPQKQQTEIELLPPESHYGRMDGMTAQQLACRKAATYAGCPSACAEKACRTHKECQAAGRDPVRCKSPLWTDDTALLERHLLRFWTWVVERREAWLAQALQAGGEAAWDKVNRMITVTAIGIASNALRRRRVMDLTDAERREITEELAAMLAR